MPKNTKISTNISFCGSTDPSNLFLHLNYEITVTKNSNQLSMPQENLGFSRINVEEKTISGLTTNFKLAEKNSNNNFLWLEKIEKNLQTVTTAKQFETIFHKFCAK